MASKLVLYRSIDFLTLKPFIMKTKTMVLSLFLSFFSCALFAQNQNDTVPSPTKTDSIPKTDTSTTDSTKASAFLNSTHFTNHSMVSNDVWALNEQSLFGNISKKKKAIAIS